MTEREIKRHIKLLKKIKKETPLRTEARRDINRRMRALKKELVKDIEPVTKEKAELIQKILKIRPYYTDIRLNMKKYTMQQLQEHFDKIRRTK